MELNHYVVRYHDFTMDSVMTTPQKLAEVRSYISSSVLDIIQLAQVPSFALDSLALIGGVRK